MDYIEAPLLLKYKYGEKEVKGYFVVGPKVGYAAAATVKEVASFLIDVTVGKQELDLTKDLYNRFEIGGVVGAGVEIPISQTKLHLDVRYDHGFSKLLDDPIIDISLKNYGIGVNAGVSYAF